jgi:nucleotide-binding universal stress UspA family protein
VEHLIAEDDPRIVVTNRDDAGLVVLGQKGRGALKSLHLGSTAEYVVQHLAAPTAIAKKQSRVRSVLVCTDGSGHAERAIDALLSMPWLGQINTMHVIGIYHIGIYDDSAEIRAAVDAAAQRLDDATELTCEPTPVMLDDNPAFAILDEASTMAADVIVLGTRGLNAIKLGLLWGSTARAVIKSAQSTVLVAHVP